jgi:DNA helicase-2/ATP-dependent DNA helicase PcrA
MISPAQLQAKDGETELVSIYRQYETDLRHFGYVDYDDLLLLPLELFRQRDDVLRIYSHTYPHVLIDEYQDTNRVQLELLKLLCPPPGNLFAVADDDQQIYGFRGASERSVRELQVAYEPMVVQLGVNYRSTENIIVRASNLMKGAAGRQPKPTQKSVLGKGPDVRFVEFDDSDEEACWVAQQIAEVLSQAQALPNQVAVLSARRADLMPIREALEASGVEALVIGAEDLRTSSLIQKVVGFLRVVDNPSDPLAVASVVGMALSDRPEGLAALLDACGGMPTAEWILDIPDGSMPALSAGDLSEIKGLFSYLLAMRDSYRGSSDLVREVSRLPYIGEEANKDPSAALDLRRLQAFATETVAGTADTSVKRLMGELAISDVDQRVQELQDVVQLHTCHGVKGLEFDIVYVVGAEDGNIPFYYSRTPRQVESDRKALYVALTRAKRQLTITWANHRRTERGQIFRRNPSPFLSDI